jgi:hypothetical protein
MKATSIVLAGMLFSAIAYAADTPEPKFRAVTIDTKIEIGYGVTIADVDGDGRRDILLADKKQFVWYRSPSWEKFVLAENLTPQDNVCIAADDIDGDGKAEVAVGAGWNPADTLKSGAVFYLKAPQDRTKKWDAIALPHVPTIHRMRWLQPEGNAAELLSVPLHGYGNRNGQGEGVAIMSYKRPDDPQQPWTTNTLVKEWHKTHNFDVADNRIYVAAAEGIFEVQPGKRDARARFVQLATNDVGGFGEVRLGQAGSQRFIAAIEPMHGTNLALFTPASGSGLWNRRVLDNTLADGHALGCGDFLKLGRDQIVVGWRAMGNSKAKVGIKMLTPLDAELKQWRTTLIDDNTMACEDLALADLNGDGQLDIIAAGRATKNVKIYFNER